MILCDLLRKKREAAGLTRAELALGSGLSLETIDSLELGEKKDPTFDTCYKISSTLTRHSRQAFILQDLWCASRGQIDLIKQKTVSSGQRTAGSEQ